MGRPATIRRKKPLTFASSAAGPKRRDAISSLHNNLKSNPSPSTECLARYQNASSKGQDARRGGDSSKVLVQWLHTPALQVLEIGCIEVDNAISAYIKNSHSTIRRIDLRSRDPRIEQQDFMTLPVPRNVPRLVPAPLTGQKYDLISLSLVLNFVPTPRARYEMLYRTTQFLRRDGVEGFPALFVVLPLPCVENSRYLTNEHFLAIMRSLGYQIIQQKNSKRMAYWLFHSTSAPRPTEWKKTLLHDGRTRNNFAICT